VRIGTATRSPILQVYVAKPGDRPQQERPARLASALTARRRQERAMRGAVTLQVRQGGSEDT